MAKVLVGNHGRIMGGQLLDMPRCPHCGIANPSLISVWLSDGGTPRTDGKSARFWGSYKCGSCGGIVTVEAKLVAIPPASRKPASTPSAAFEIIAMFPAPKTAHEDVPSVARTFLQQAYETLHAPDAATVMAASAVDAMLKEVGLINGSLYNRIDEALQKNILTQGMSDWAHAVRLDANAVRHADQAKPHATADEAKQTVEFAEALGNFLFVLTAKINRGIKAAQGSSGNL